MGEKEERGYLQGLTAALVLTLVEAGTERSTATDGRAAAAQLAAVTVFRRGEDSSTKTIRPIMFSKSRRH